ncbi:uncharacterized protein TNCV_196931 [Trichonephila clavipes]|uniref:Uncharacterized protein n=1 Tax=Trichonephila clavipes TaxID=2585209 RepID=A0A8X6WIA6_TRICX|nr:uncharacterized protein TNCV_196931 [Trichonephila clavipes]
MVRASDSRPEGLGSMPDVAKYPPSTHGGLCSNPGEGMDVCECKVPSWHEGTLNSHRVASLLVKLVEGEERWKAPDHPQGVLPQNCGGTEKNRTVTCMVLKATVDDR